MISDEQRRAMIDSIRRLPAELERAVDGKTEQELDTPYRDGGWTVRQVVHHLADSHMNAFVRMKLILTEHNPTLKPYNQDAWALTGDVGTMPLGPSLVLLKGLHERWAALLGSLPMSAWSRTAFHPEDGEVTLEGLLRTYSRHGERHVEQIKGAGGKR